MAATLTDFKDGLTATGYAGSSTIGPFTLLGGKYAVTVSDTGTPDASLQILLPDGSTYQTIGSAITTNSSETVDLPPGTYRVTTGTGTSLSVSVIRIPYRRA